MGAAPEEHSRLAPSSAYRWSVCPHSANVVLPPQEAGKAAADGTEVHAYIARRLNGQENTQVIKTKDKDNAELYISHVLENEADEMLVEHRWESVLVPDWGGTVDTALFTKGEDATLCAVYDYKNGRWPVQAQDNKQLLSYAAIISEHRPDVEEFFGVIIQPNSSDKLVVKPIARFTLDAISDFRGTVEWAAQSDDVVTGEHCRFCPLRKAAMCKPGRDYAESKGWRS